MHYIKDIYEKKETEHAHNKFIRYSKGVFTGPLITIKIGKSGIKLNSSFHLSDEILMIMGNHFGEKEVHVKGSLAWNKDLAPELAKSGIKYLKVVKSRGIFNYNLDNTVAMKTFVDNMGKYYILISFKEGDIKLTTKPKLPKPNKEISGDFCKTNFPPELTDMIIKEFAFDVKNLKGVKEIEIRNQFFVEDIVFPDEDEKLEFDDIRRLAKRKGMIKRTIILNKDETKMVETQIPFLV